VTQEKTSHSKENSERATSESPAFFVHPQGLAESDHIGEGTRIWAFAHVLKGAKVGEHCNIGECVFVENGAQIGNHVTLKNGVQIWAGVICEDYVFVGPNATFTNDLRPRVKHPVDPELFAATTVKTGASIGANATIVAGITIGESALIGAGCVVIRDVPAHALVVGNPAHQIGWVCGCGERLNDSLLCVKCGAKHSYREDKSEGLNPL